MGNDPDSGAVVFLLGAGASKDAGCLTVRELTDQFPEWSRQNKVSRSLLGAYTWLRDQLGTMPAVSNGSQGNKVGEIRLRAEHTKTHRARTIGLEVSPALRAMLAAMKLRARKDAMHVFELPPDRDGKALPYTADLVEAARQRLMRPGDKDGYGAPGFDWQTLRSTCATYLTNAPGIFGAATVFMSAKQLGHSVPIAERHYFGVHRGIPRDAHTLEAAMQLEQTLQELTRATAGTTRRDAIVQVQ